MKKHILLILLSIFGGLSAAWANCPTDDTTLSDALRSEAASISAQKEGDKSAMLLAQFVDNGCFGGSLDTNVFSQDLFNKITQANRQVGNHIAFKEEVKNLFAELIQYSFEQMNQASQLETNKAWMLLLKQLNHLHLTMDSTHVDFGISRQELTTLVSDEYNGFNIVSSNCSDLWRDDACIQAIKETGALFRALLLASEVVRVANLPVLNSHIVNVSTRLKGFSNYYDKAEPLWWWEHWINKPVVTSKDVIINGNLQGFRDPVPYQILFLHPTTALQYVNDQDAKLKPAVIMDVLGFNMLDWEQGGGDLDSYGASVILSLSEMEGKTNLGWGLRFFYNKTYSFGITKNSDQIGFFISVGAVERVNGWNDEKDDYMKVYHDLMNKL